MPTHPPQSNFHRLPRKDWLEELQKIMNSDPCLRMHIHRLEHALFFSDSHPVPDSGHNRVMDWHDDTRHLLVYRAEATGKFTIIGFEVLNWRWSFVAGFQAEAIIEIDLLAHASIIEDQPVVILVISVGITGSIRVVQIFGPSHHTGSEASVVAIGDLQNRFAGNVENILDQIAFVAEVLGNVAPGSALKS